VEQPHWDSNDEAVCEHIEGDEAMRSHIGQVDLLLYLCNNKIKK
jgi:hypothetical protein